jgi:predicted phosphate transport protein (TIGR00153 family)
MSVRDTTEEFRRHVDDAVLVLFALVTESIGWATVALLDQDVERAQAVIDGDRGIDERCEALVAVVKERLSTAMLQPVELENLVAVLQIVPELERSADLAEHIAQRSMDQLGGMISPNSRGLIQSMSDVAVRMWQTAGTAYRQGSREASFQLQDADDELDELASRLVSEGTMSGVDPEVAVALALLARFYERLGDHAVNLARRVDVMAAPRRLTRLPTLRRSTSSAEAAPPREKRGGLRRVLHGLSRFRVVPSDDAFFDLFRSAADNARDCAGALGKLVTAVDGANEEAFDMVRACERRGDEITVDLLRRLDASFVTPYDREDIHALAEELDDVVDDMFSAASLLQLADHDQRPPELQELADVIVAMTDEMLALIDCLQTNDGARFRLERIEHLERQADAIYQRGLARLFNGEYEPLEVIKLKDVVQSLEGSCNAIEDVSDVVESILVKNS